MVDFTTPDAVARERARGARARASRASIGTTRLRPRARSTRSRAERGLAVLLRAELRARRGADDALRAPRRRAHLPRAEIVELHHEAKHDAPSGTAKATAELIGGRRADPLGAPARASSRTRRCSSAATGQLLTIRHDTFSREAFVPGVLLALERLHAPAGPDRRAGHAALTRARRRDAADGGARRSSRDELAEVWPATCRERGSTRSSTRTPRATASCFLARARRPGGSPASRTATAAAAGQWWHDRVARRSDDAAARRWLVAVAFRVRRAATSAWAGSRRAGSAARLHDALLARSRDVRRRCCSTQVDNELRARALRAAVAGRSSSELDFGAGCLETRPRRMRRRAPQSSRGAAGSAAPSPPPRPASTSSRPMPRAVRLATTSAPSCRRRVRARSSARRAVGETDDVVVQLRRRRPVADDHEPLAVVRSDGGANAVRMPNATASSRSPRTESRLRRVPDRRPHASVRSCHARRGPDRDRHAFRRRRRRSTSTRFQRLAQHLVDNGSDGLVVAGTTGESPTLTDDERLELFRAAVDAVGDRATVVAGTGTYSTAHSVHLTERAHELGVDAFLVVTPYYNKPPQRGIVEHFEAIARVERPADRRLQHPEPRRRSTSSRRRSRELAEIPNVTAVKQANDDLDAGAPHRRDSGLDLYAGDDNLIQPFLELGGIGGDLRAHARRRAAGEGAWCAPYREGDVDAAREIDARARPVVRAAPGGDEPDRDQGRAEPARPRRRRPPAAARRGDRRRARASAAASSACACSSPPRSENRARRRAAVHFTP